MRQRHWYSMCAPQVKRPGTIPSIMACSALCIIVACLAYACMNCAIGDMLMQRTFLGVAIKAPRPLQHPVTAHCMRIRAPKHRRPREPIFNYVFNFGPEGPKNSSGGIEGSQGSAIISASLHNCSVTMPWSLHENAQALSVLARKAPKR